MVSTKLLFECDHNRPQPLPPFKQLCLWGSCDSAPLGSDKRYGCVIRKTPPGQSRKLDSLCVATDRNCGCWGYVLDGAFMPLRGLMLYSKETKIVEVACDEWKKKKCFFDFSLEICVCLGQFTLFEMCFPFWSHTLLFPLVLDYFFCVPVIEIDYKKLWSVSCLKL